MDRIQREGLLEEDIGFRLDSEQGRDELVEVRAEGDDEVRFVARADGVRRGAGGEEALVKRGGLVGQQR
jgi:hypothetical protein